MKKTADFYNRYMYIIDESIYVTDIYVIFKRIMCSIKFVNK